LQKLFPLSGKKVLDLYAGAGNFSIPLAAHADEVVAVEENRFAVDDGIRNIELNNLKNCRLSGYRLKSTSSKINLMFSSRSS